MYVCISPLFRNEKHPDAEIIEESFFLLQDSDRGSVSSSSSDMNEPVDHYFTTLRTLGMTSSDYSLFVRPSWPCYVSI